MSNKVTMNIDQMTGPIVACDNAIKHYDEALEQLYYDENKMLEKLARCRDSQALLREKRFQWVVARGTLVADGYEGRV